MNFHEGDFVLVRKMRGIESKLRFKWVGPRRVLEEKSPSVYVLENLLTKEREVAHSRRIQLYRSDMEGIEADTALLKSMEHLESTYKSAKALQDICVIDSNIHILVEWEGLPDRCDFTWEPLLQVHEDLPEMLDEYLASAGSKVLKGKARQELSV